MLMSDTAWPDQEYVRGIRIDARDGFVDIMMVRCRRKSLISARIFTEG